MRIAVKHQGGGNISIGKIRIKKIVVDCQGTEHHLRFSIRGGAPVNAKRKFRIRASDGTGGQSRISGKFARSFKRIRGKIRVFGEFQAEGGGTIPCNSGTERFRAT